MQEIGLPTYWVAVITNEHVNSSTAVKWLCIRNSTESVMTSCRFRYLLSPPSNLYMIARTCRYREPRGPRPPRRRTKTRIAVTWTVMPPCRCRAPPAPPATSTHLHQHHVRIPEGARCHLSSSLLSSRRITTNFRGGPGCNVHEDVPSTGTNERSSSTALSRERKQQNETRERHERVRLSTRRASLPPPSFFLLLPSRLHFGTPAASPSSSIAPPLALSLFLAPPAPSLSLSPSFRALLPRGLSFSP